MDRKIGNFEMLSLIAMYICSSSCDTPVIHTIMAESRNTALAVMKIHFHVSEESPTLTDRVPREAALSSPGIAFEPPLPRIRWAARRARRWRQTEKTLQRTIEQIPLK
jgi:hypothetical protein